MRTKDQSIKAPKRGDEWQTCMIKRVVHSKKYGLLAVWTTGGGRTPALEAMGLDQFARWAKKAEYLGRVSPCPQ